MEVIETLDAITIVLSALEFIVLAVGLFALWWRVDGIGDDVEDIQEDMDEDRERVNGNGVKASQDHSDNIQLGLAKQPRTPPGIAIYELSCGHSKTLTGEEVSSCQINDEGQIDLQNSQIVCYKCESLPISEEGDK
jgi:hypothetical protein